MLVGSACTGAASAQTDASGQPSTGTPACRAAELKAVFRGFQPAGGSLTGAVVIVDSGAQPCRLTGTPPSVTMLIEDGSAVAVRSRPLALPATTGAVELAPSAQLPAFGAPPPRGSAWFPVTWSNWCADASPDVRSLLVVLPAGGSVAAPLDGAAPGWLVASRAPRCDDARAGSTVTIGRFQAPGT